TSSRATRVWIVRRVTGASDSTDTLSEACYVLKDAWIDDDAPLQKTIQQEIFANFVQAKENGDKDLQDVSEEDYRQHFMNIVSDWVVTFGDGTRDLRFKLPNTDDDSDNSDNASISSSTENDYSPRRKHVRTIFAEVCQTIFEVRDVRSMILTLQGVTKALWYMWKAGYVHRDVSAGNCLWNGEVGKLSDLEYAKKHDTLEIHDPVTVWLYFP
ncbi:hypothetical protein H0H92_014544, partial [Tricholoma furcatifolium]